MHTARDIPKEVSDWAKANENVRVAILTSTRKNPNAPVDALSDYDIELSTWTKLLPYFSTTYSLSF